MIMGDISIMARRLPGGHVHYGYSGSGGYYRNVGTRLLEWYDDPSLVEYLFGLGQLSLIGAPQSEYGGFHWIETHQCNGLPHHYGTTEREIFSQIAFIDYGYFYDSDNTWYYVVPGPFRIKMPLKLLEHHLDEQGYEFDYQNEINGKIIAYIFNEFLQEDEEFQSLLKEQSIDAKTLCEQLLQESFPIDEFFHRYRTLFDYFDDWILVITNKECTDIIDFKIKKKGEKHIETIEW